MSKLAHPPQLPSPLSLSDLRQQIATSLDDALFEIGEADRSKRAARGVLPTLDPGARVPSMSLGTPRLCNDRTSPAHSTTIKEALSGYDGSTPIACIEWQRVTFYREAIRSKKPPTPSLFRDQNLTRGDFNGYMSPATRRKVRKIASTWIRSIMLYRAEVKKRWDPGRAYPVFLTLTLPHEQIHTDAEINRKCLQPFLQRLKRDYEIENYFWRAEAQENGNLHYHLLIDRYIPKRYLQISWNNCVDALGYLERYFYDTGSLTPPSTEVHRIRDKVMDRKTGKWKTVDPVDYLLEYVMDTPTPEEPVTDAEGREGPEDQSVKDQSVKPRKLIGRYRASDGSIQEYVTRPISGRVWGMSDTLREIREPRAEATVDMVTALEKAKNKGLLRRVDLEHATMYFGPVGLVLSRASASSWALIKEYYLHVFGHLYPAQLPREYLERHPPIDPRNLWIDLDNSALYHRLQLEQDSPAFETAADLEAWMDQQRKAGQLNKARA